MKIRLKVAILVSGTLILLLPFLSYVYYIHVKKSFLSAIYSHLESISETKSIRLKDVTEKRLELIKLLSSNTIILNSVANREAAINTKVKEELHEIFNRYLKAINSIENIYICKLNGAVILASDTLGSKDFSRRPSYRQALKGYYYWGDFHVNEKGKLNTYLSSPLYDHKKNRLGIIIIETDASEIISLTSDYTGLGKSGETVLGIKANGTTLVNPLRFDKSNSLKRTLNPSDPFIPMNKALEGFEGILENGMDYRNVEVISSTRYFPNLKWGMVTKIDKEEAFTPINNLMQYLIYINMVGIVATFIIAYFGSGVLIKPLEKLTRSVNNMKKGLFSERVPVTTNDEIGTLASSFNDLAANLEKKISDLDSFAYTASHDLKAPIANLEGLLYALEKSLEGKTGDKEKELLKMFSLSIAKFKNTVKDMSNLTQLQLSTPEEKQFIEFEDIFEEIKHSLNNVIKEASADIITDFNASTIHFSRKDLNSILQNLLTNAIKYRSPVRRPLIHISTKKEKDYVMLSVEDNGLGFDPVNKDRLFRMFKRLHHHVEGSGIGLYLIKRIVDMNGGYIEVDSTPGKGSIFKIYLK